MNDLRRCAAALLIGLASAASFAADAWPSKPITIINPWTAGGPAELVIRAVAEPLQQRLGQTVIVDSRGGANGTIGAAAVARAAPDGYTLLSGHVGPIVIAPALPQKPPYDSVKDFVPITQLVSGATVLVVRSDSPHTTLAALMAWAKANPGKLTYGSVGIGSTTHLAGATLARMTGTELTHIPYKGSAPINTDLLGGQIVTAFVNVAGVLPLIQSGKLRPLAVSTTRRTSVLADVPAVAETLPGFEVNSWYGLMAPAGTPAAIVERLHKEVAAILETPAIVAKLREYGLEPEGTTPAAFATKIKADLLWWQAAVKAADIKE